MNRDATVGGMGGAPARPAWGGRGAARKASWRRRGLKNQPKPQVKKGRTESQAEKQKVGAPRREGKVKRGRNVTCRQEQAEGAAGTRVQATPRVPVTPCE